MAEKKFPWSIIPIGIIAFFAFTQHTKMHGGEVTPFYIILILVIIGLGGYGMYKDGIK